MCLDIFEVDPAKCWLQAGDDLNQLQGILFVDLDIEHIDAGEFLEQDSLAFHHGLGGQRTNIAQAKHRGTVRDYANQIAARRIPERIGRIDDDLFAGSRHAR